VIEGNSPRIDVSGLQHITKIIHMINDLEKLLPIIGYVNETLFKRCYMRIQLLMRLPAQAMIVKVLLNF